MYMLGGGGGVGRGCEKEEVGRGMRKGRGGRGMRESDVG